MQLTHKHSHKEGLKTHSVPSFAPSAVLALLDRNFKKHLFCCKTYSVHLAVKTKLVGLKSYQAGLKKVSSLRTGNLVCIMWLLGLLTWEICKCMRIEKCQILFVHCITFQLYCTVCCHSVIVRSFRLTLTCLPSLSADGYEEHSMDATDSQHYKGVQQLVFLIIFSYGWRTLTCASFPCLCFLTQRLIFVCLLIK